MFMCQFPLCSLSNSIDKILNHHHHPPNMYQSEKPSKRADKFMKEKHQYPSFSASLLEKIYRSIDESEAAAAAAANNVVDDLMLKKQSKSSGRSSKVTTADMWHLSPEQEGKSSNNNHHIIHNNNSSWDFNSVRFSSSSDTTESIFTPPPPLSRPKPVKISVSKTDKEEEEEHTTTTISSYQQTEEEKQKRQTTTTTPLSSYQQRFDDDYSPKSNPPPSEKPKSMALKIYANLKQPISPGGRFVSFINSLFTPATTTSTVKKKTNNLAAAASSLYDMSNNNNNEVNPKSEKSSTCPSPCSFSPSSCLSKTNQQQKLHNGRNRSVRFHTTTMTAALEEQKPFPIKAVVYGQGSSSVSDAIRPPISKIVSGGRSYPHTFDVRKRHVKSRRRIEAAVGEFFKDYDDDDDEDDDDDASTCSSSDLFELDGLSVLASDSRYSKELPVYETTRFELGRRNLGYLANGLIF